MSCIEGRECATILAALRLLQEAVARGRVPEDIERIASDEGVVEPLSFDEIEGLVERLNTTGYPLELEDLLRQVAATTLEQQREELYGMIRHDADSSLHGLVHLLDVLRDLVVGSE